MLPTRNRGSVSLGILPTSANRRQGTLAVCSAEHRKNSLEKFQKLVEAGTRRRVGPLPLSNVAMDCVELRYIAPSCSHNVEIDGPTPHHRVSRTERPMLICHGEFGVPRRAGESHPFERPRGGFPQLGEVLGCQVESLDIQAGQCVSDAAAPQR